MTEQERQENNNPPEIYWEWGAAYDIGYVYVDRNGKIRKARWYELLFARIRRFFKTSKQS